MLKLSEKTDGNGNYTGKDQKRMIDLKDSREKIDAIDQEIVRLFEERMAVAEQVAEYKIQTGKPVLDIAREQEKLARLTAMAHDPENALGIRELFRQVMSTSRRRQYQILTKHGIGEDRNYEVVDELPKEGATVVFQGVEGAYSYAAMQAYFPENIHSFHVKTWKDAIEEILEGRADYAVLPIENSTAGIVSDIYDLLTDYEDVYIVGEQIIRCAHVLMGLPGTDLSKVQRVYSHEQALMQCGDFLDMHPAWERIPLENTAVAAKRVHKEKDSASVAIASTQAAGAYGLCILAEHIYNNENNSTRFVIVSRKRRFEKSAGKVSICFEVRHETGTLYSVLSHIIYNGLNMSKIESRPIPKKNWQYRFFVDFDGNLEDGAVKNALRGIRQEASYMRVFGNYRTGEQKK